MTDLRQGAAAGADHAGTQQPTPRIALVDGATTTPLSAEALVVALFVATEAGQILPLALHFQGELDAGRTITLTTSRVVRPTNGGGLVPP